LTRYQVLTCEQRDTLMKKGVLRVAEEREVQAGVVRGVLDGIEEIAGVKGRKLVLRHANLEEYLENPPPMDDKVFVPAAHYQAICRGLLEFFGTKGARVLLIYVGEATFRRAIEGLPGLFASAMKFMPGGLKKRAVFKVSAMQIARITGVPPKIDIQRDRIIIHYFRCPSCDGYQSDQPVCFYECGMLMALAEWATGKKHRATEVECAAMGHEACVFEIVEVERGS
jgi:hypothetical protein